MTTKEHIKQLHSGGKGATEIARELGMPRQTVQSIINKKKCKCGQLFYSATFNQCTHCSMLKRATKYNPRGIK